MRLDAGVTAMIRSMAADLGLPVVTYYGLHALGADDTTALLAGTLAAGARLIWVAVRSRTVSYFSMVMGAVFGVGLIFTLLTGDARFLLIKHSVMSAVIGVLFLITAFRGSKPLTLSAQQSFVPAKAAEIAAAYASNPEVQRGHQIASVVWGGGLLIEAAVRVVLVYLLPVEVMVGLSTVLTVMTFTLLIGWNARFIGSRKAAAAKAAVPELVNA
ncbi:VC0807 family protein [Actinoplanes sp. NPDC020271]|uniref:VC0807 family protein n=1 Tax=Actinoplanes sp. NPDC020271 TaxID=3363896 RepID=UPI0037B1FC37